MVLDFLKKFFNLKKIKEEKVELKSIESWFREKVKEKERALSEKAEEYFLKIKGLFDNLKEAKKFLENQEIREVKVENKIKQVVLDNKRNYLQYLSKFLEMDFPEEISINKIYNFHLELKSTLDKFAKESQKSYSIAQHLFYEGVEGVNKLIGELSKEVERFDKLLEKKGYNKISEVEKKISKLKEMQVKKEEVKNQIKEKEAKKKELLEEIHKKEKKITDLRESESYDEFKSLVEKKENLEEKLKELRKKVDILFSPLERVFRKYNKKNPSEVIDEYLEDSLKALEEDKGTAIFTLIKEMRYNLDGLGFYGEEKEKVEKHLGIEEEELKKLRKDLVEKKEELKTVKKKKANNQAKDLIEEEKYKVSHFREKVGKIEEEKEHLEEVRSKINLESKKEDVKESLKGIGCRVRFA